MTYGGRKKSRQQDDRTNPGDLKADPDPGAIEYPPGVRTVRGDEPLVVSEIL